MSNNVRRRYGKAWAGGLWEEFWCGFLERRRCRAAAAGGEFRVILADGRWEEGAVSVG